MASGVIPSHRVSNSRLRASKKPSLSEPVTRQASSFIIRSPIMAWHWSSDQVHKGSVCVRWIRSVKLLATSRLSVWLASGFNVIPRFCDARASSSWSLAKGDAFRRGCGVCSSESAAML
jgi:hypothetical protein